MSELRKHTSEQKSRRSSGHHVKTTDPVTVAYRRTDGAGASKRQEEFQVRGTPRQVVEVVNGLRERRTTTSSSGGSSKLRLPHMSTEHATSSSVVRRSSRETTRSRIQAPPNSQVVARTRTYSTTAVKSYGSSYESRQTVHQASYYSTCPATNPSYYRKVESKDVVIRSTRHK